MTFLTDVFPEQISLDAHGGPEFNTDVVIYGGGNESRSDNWDQARLRWEVSHAARLPKAWKKLVCHFRKAKGRARAFPFKDWTDYTVVDGEGILTHISGSTWQLTKLYCGDSPAYERFIYLPRQGTITIVGGGTLNYSTGVVTGGAPTSWTGQFYVPARYDTDQMTGQIVEKKGNGDLIMGWDSIPIVETRDYT